MTATGFLYRHLVRHPDASGARPRRPTAPAGTGTEQQPPHVEEASSREHATGQAQAMPPHPEAPAGRDVRRTREIAEYLPYARYLAARFGMPAGSSEDLRRVALLGLVEAVDGFDPDTGITLLAHAASTIRDQVRYHLRDTARAMRAPRRIEEIADDLPAAIGTLSRRLNRSPTVDEVAALVDACPEDVIDAIDLADRRAQQHPGQPKPTDHDGRSRPVAAAPVIGHRPDRDRLRALLARLSRRDKQIL